MSKMLGITRMIDATAECVSCRKLLNISHNEVRPLALGDVSNDVMPIVEYTTAQGAA